MALDQVSRGRTPLADELPVTVGMHEGAEFCRNSDFSDLAQAVENVANVIGLHRCRNRLQPGERSDNFVGFGDEKRIERVQLLRPEAGQKGMSGLLSGSRPSGDSGTLDCRYRNQNPCLAERRSRRQR